MTVALGRLSGNRLLESFESILAFYFGNIESSTIKKLTSSSLSEFNISDIKKVSSELGLKSSYKKLEIASIQKYMLPCIAISKSGDSVVIYDIDDKKAVIQRGKYSDKEVVVLSSLKSYDRFVFVTKPEKESQFLEVGNKKDKSWFFTPIKKEWRAYVEVAILTIFINIFGLALPLFTMNVYNRVIPNFATETLFVLAFGVGMIAIFDIVLKSARVSIVDKVTTKLANHFEEELFKKVLTIKSEYNNYLTGTKTNLFRELSVVKDFFSTKIISLFDIPFFFLALLVIYIISPMMAIVPVVAATLLLGFNYAMQFPMSKLHKQNFKGAQSKQAFLVEQLQGEEAIKLSNALTKRTSKWIKIVSFYNHIQSKTQFLSSISFFISQGLLQAVSLFTVIVGVYAIHDGTLSVGGLIAVTILAARSMVPIIALSNSLTRYKQVKESLESLNNYWHLPSENQKYIELGMGRAKGDISFEDVTFAYPNSQYPSVSNATFSIKAGEKVGIIGQTGAGKSTIQKLLTGILKPTSGRIFIDNMDISTLHPVELRENIALMPQEPYIFSGTLKENLELSRSISKQEMSELLDRTGLSSLVKKAGSADDFQVGERGSNLSVGQRHLVALARAMMSDAPILILDEPTTGLDVGLEKSLVSELKNSVKDRTLIVISHRFAALDLVDRVIVINDGKIVADGEKNQILQMLQGKKS